MFARQGRPSSRLHGAHWVGPVAKQSPAAGRLESLRLWDALRLPLDTEAVTGKTTGCRTSVIREPTRLRKDSPEVTDSGLRVLARTPPTAPGATATQSVSLCVPGRCH